MRIKEFTPVEKYYGYSEKLYEIKCLLTDDEIKFITCNSSKDFQLDLKSTKTAKMKLDKIGIEVSGLAEFKELPNGMRIVKDFKIQECTMVPLTKWEKEYKNKKQTENEEE